MSIKPKWNPEFNFGHIFIVISLAGSAMWAFRAVEMRAMQTESRMEVFSNVISNQVGFIEYHQREMIHTLEAIQDNLANLTTNQVRVSTMLIDHLYPPKP